MRCPGWFSRVMSGGRCGASVRREGRGRRCAPGAARRAVSGGGPVSTAHPDVLEIINPPRNKRLLAFRILAALPIILFAVNATNLLAPWTFILTPDDKLPEPHRWFFVVSAAADLLLMASFVGLVVKPRLTVLAAWIPVSLVIVLVTIVPLQPEFLILVGIVVLPATIAYPYW